MIHRRGNGLRQAARATTGTFWLCPSGVAEDEICITSHIAEMLHIYLPGQPLGALSHENGYPDLDTVNVAYDTGPHDVWIAAVAQTVAAELLTETASDRLLVKTAGLALAAALAHNQGAGLPPCPWLRLTRSILGGCNASSPLSRLISRMRSLSPTLPRSHV